MGHSDAFSFQELERASANAESPAVHVWGDTSYIRLPEPAGDANAGGGEAIKASAAEGHDNSALYQRVGHLTRTLHNALHELGYHDSLVDARDHLPDARDRLAYIARLTGDAAEKVLNSVDRARCLQDAMSARAKGLQARWGALDAIVAGVTGRSGTPGRQELIEETCAFLGTLDDQAAQTNAILTEIMMAQDFHDLTGQVIRKVVSLSQELEEQLVNLLIEATPVEQRKKIEANALEGPVVNSENRTDVVTDQAGVDDLLASLGF
jgi:chemotaxis protein CheZ